MSDINVIAHGINPETGEYLSKSDRKALFKKGRMGSKIDPSVFKSGVVSGVQAAQKVRQKAESDVGDDAAAAGGGGSSRGAIVPIQKLTTPNEDIGKVNVEDSGSKENNVEENNVEESKESFKDALKKLLETLQRITRLKSKQGKSGKKTDKLKSKKRKTKKKERKTPGRDIFGIGRKIKGKVTNMFGDIFGIFGDIIAFAALGWITDPKNKKAVKGIITFMGHAFKFINFFVGRFIDNTLTGLAQLLGPDRSIGERFSGALKLIGSFFMYKWIRFPWTIIKDVKKLTGIFKKFGKFVNKIFGKPVKMIQNFVQKSLNKTLGKVFMSNLFKPFRRFIIQVGGKSLYKLLGAVGRGFIKVLSRIPFLGALLEFFLDVFIFKKPLKRSAFKAIGGALLGSIGMLGGPIGAIIGGWIGNEAGGWLFDAWFGSGHNPDDPKKDDSSSTPGSTPGSTPTTFSGELNLGGSEFGEGPLRKAGEEAGYSDKEMAAFLAQMSHETGSFQFRREISGGRDYYGGHTGPWTDANGKTYTTKYHGRGYIQLTHDYNYKKYGDMFGVDLINNPDLAMQGDLAAKISVSYWNENVRPTVGGDWDNVFLHSKAINYPAATSPAQINGMADRQAKYNAYLQKLGGGGGTGMVRRAPDKSIAKMTGTPVESAKMTRTPVTRNPVKNLMPSMSAEFTINEKIKTNQITEPPIIIYNEEKNLGLHTTGLNLNTDEESRNPVLRRL